MKKYTRTWLLGPLGIIASLVIGSPVASVAAVSDHGWAGDPWQAAAPSIAPGSAVQASLIKDINPSGASHYMPDGNAKAIGGTLFFAADEGVNGNELWRSDGTDPGTFRVTNIGPGSIPSEPSALTAVNNLLYFVPQAYGEGLWRTDGTEGGTIQLLGTSTYPNYLADCNGALYFSAVDATNGNEPWKSDGTQAGTIRVVDVCPGTCGSHPYRFTFVNGYVYFGTNFNSQPKVWKTDGSSGGTTMVMNLGFGSYGPESLTRYANLLFFVGGTEIQGWQLWKSDGTTSGTVIVNPGASYGFRPQGLTEVAGTLFFSGVDGNTNRELWKTDGTAAGTVRIKDVNATGASNPQNLVGVDGTLYFTADNGIHGRELWKSDGTEPGTQMVKDISLSGSSNPRSLVNVSGTLFFTADDGTGDREVWMSDGTAAGTVRVADINPTGSSDPISLVNVDGTLFFFPDDGVHGREPWKVELLCDFAAPPGMGIEDLQAIAGRWGQHSGDPGWDALYDLDHDGDVDIVDILQATAAWGGCL